MPKPALETQLNCKKLAGVSLLAEVLHCCTVFRGYLEGPF